MAEHIIIWINCPKIGCYRGICYCHECDHFKGLNETKDEIICEWKEKSKNRVIAKSKANTIKKEM